MNKPDRLKIGDKVAIVSLSRGVLGESFASHEVVLGEKRLREFGLEPVYMDNSLKGIDYLQQHPEARADDLKQAIGDRTIRGIICAIGGDDTFRTLPYLMNDEEFIKSVETNPKVFLGFSDSTINHLMFYKLGLETYYGQSFLTDLAEFGDEMLPFSKEWFGRLLDPANTLDIQSSDSWYLSRPSFGVDQVGVNLEPIPEKRGFEVLYGSGVVEGRLLGGCIESLGEILLSDRYPEEFQVISEAGIFPSADTWRDKVVFLETSEEEPTPKRLATLIEALDSAEIFKSARAILVGKPMNETYYEDYKDLWLEIAHKYDLPVLYNMNFGHSVPRGILPYNGLVQIDFDNKTVKLLEPLVL